MPRKKQAQKSDFNFENRTIWTGDNLHILRGINSNCVDLIYLDPPFNSKTDYAAPIGSKAAGAAFKDTWGLDDIDLIWHGTIKKEHPGLYAFLTAVKEMHGSSMMSYLIYMCPRLIEMERILKPTGSIYLHCDDHANAQLRLVMDAIFGKGRFRNEITWKRTFARDAGSFARVSDTILFYGPPINKDSVRIDLGLEYVAQHYNKKDKRGVHRHVLLTGAGTRRGDSGKPWRGVDPTKSGRHWAVPKKGLPGWFAEPAGYSNMNVQEKLDVLDKQGLIHWPKKEGGKPNFKRYLSENKGQIPTTIWTDINPVSANANERTYYPTQKPVELLRRIIRASSNPDDVFMDTFCGCATGCVAAEDEGRQWIGIDISPKAAELVEYRIEKELGFLVSDSSGRRGKVIRRTDIPNRTDLGDIPPYNCTENKDRLYGVQRGHCNGCTEHFEARHLEIDHIIPQSQKGSDHISNLQLLCGNCNRIKGNRSQEYLLAQLRKRGIARRVLLD